MRARQPRDQQKRPAGYLFYYEHEEQPPAPRPWRQLGRDALALVYGCAVFAAAIVASDWVTR